MKFILLAGIIYVVYRFVNPPKAISGKDDKQEIEFTDYEEID